MIRVRVSVRVRTRVRGQVRVTVCVLLESRFGFVLRFKLGLRLRQGGLGLVRFRVGFVSDRGVDCAEAVRASARVPLERHHGGQVTVHATAPIRNPCGRGSAQRLGLASWPGCGQSYVLGFGSNQVIVSGSGVCPTSVSGFGIG